MAQTPQQMIESKLMLSFAGRAAPRWVRALLAERQIAGFSLFGPENYESPEQVRELTASLQAVVAQLGRPPLLIAVDQEGGQLNALGAGMTHFAGNMALGAVNDVNLARAVGHAIGRELRALGVNVNYAPICDLNTQPRNPSLGVRSLGDEPGPAGALAAALVSGLQAAGVAATLKHFPGKGDARVDSHYQLPLLDHSRERLARVELPPFEAAIQAGAWLIMTGHFALPSVTGSLDLPATLSRAAMHDLVRHELNFRGVVITDALDMGAITQGAGQIVDVIAAVRAGVDLLLLMPDRPVQKRVEAGLKLAYSRGLIRDEHLRPSLGWLDALRFWLAGFEQPALDVVNCAAHRALARELAERSITLLRDRANLLPLRLPADARIAAVMPQPKDLTPADSSSTVAPTLAAALCRYHARVDEFITGHPPTDEEIAALPAQLANYDLLVIGTVGASMEPQQAILAARLLATGIPAVTVALRTPYDLGAYPQADTHLCTYSILPESMDALAAVLWGEMAPAGRLPVSISDIYPRGHGLALGEAG